MGRGEQVILSSRSHALTLTPAIFLLLSSAMLASFASSMMPTSRLLGYLATGFALWLLLLALGRAIRWVSTFYILTNRRLVVQTGFFNTVQTSIHLARIEAVELQTPHLAPQQQADLTVYSLGEAYRLPRIPQGKRYSRQIHRAQHEDSLR